MAERRGATRNDYAHNRRGEACADHGAPGSGGLGEGGGGDVGDGLAWRLPEEAQVIFAGGVGVVDAEDVGAFGESDRDRDGARGVAGEAADLGEGGGRGVGAAVEGEAAGVVGDEGEGVAAVGGDVEEAIELEGVVFRALAEGIGGDGLGGASGGDGGASFGVGVAEAGDGGAATEPTLRERRRREGWGTQGVGDDDGGRGPRSQDRRSCWREA